VADRRTGWLELGRSPNWRKPWRYSTQRMGCSHARCGRKRLDNGGIARPAASNYPSSDGPYGSRRGFTFGNMSKVPIRLYFRSVRPRMQDLFKSLRRTDRVFTSCGVTSIVDASIHAKLLLDLLQTGCSNVASVRFIRASIALLIHLAAPLCWHKKPHPLLLQLRLRRSPVVPTYSRCSTAMCYSKPIDIPPGAAL
jgi:hypothetical protein